MVRVHEHCLRAAAHHTSEFSFYLSQPDEELLIFSNLHSEVQHIFPMGNVIWG